MCEVFVIVIRGARSHWPKSDFDSLGNSKNFSIQTLRNYDIINKLSYEKNDFISDFVEISNQYVSL
jgi:hypothetical protein